MQRPSLMILFIGAFMVIIVLSSAIANNQDTSIAVLSTNVIRETRSAVAKKKAAKGKKNQKKKSMRRRRKGKANGKGRKKAFRGKEIKKARNGKSKRKTGRTAFRQSDDCVKGLATLSGIFGIQARNFYQQASRALVKSKQKNSKVSKKNDFVSSLTLIRKYASGSEKDLTCVTGKIIQGTADTLNNCSASINTACNKELPVNKLSTIEKCKAACEGFRSNFTNLFTKASLTSTQICMNIDSLTITQLKGEIEDNCKTITADSKLQITEKKACDTAFQACRKAERETASIVVTCNDKEPTSTESPYKTTSSSANSTRISECVVNSDCSGSASLCYDNTCYAVKSMDESLGEEIRKLKAEIEPLKAVVVSLISSFDTIKTNLNSVKSDLDTTKLDLVTTKSELDTTKSELDTTKSELDTTKSELDTTKSELDTTKSDLVTTMAVLNTTMTDLNTTNSVLDNTKSDLATTKADLVATKVDLFTTKADLGTAKSELEILMACFKDPTDLKICRGTYSEVSTLPLLLDSKCDSSKCAILTADLDTVKLDLNIVKACFKDPSDNVTCRATYNSSSTLPLVLSEKCAVATCTSLATDLNTTKSSLSSDLDAVIACFNDPASATCRGSYNGSSTLPMVLAGSADLDAVKACFNDPASTTCRGSYNGSSTLPMVLAGSADLDAVKACFNDPTSTICRTSYGGSSALPLVLFNKCDGSTCISLKSDLDVVKDCFTNPEGTLCKATYGGVATLPLILASKCDGSICTTLTSDVSVVKSDMDIIKACFTDPSDTSICRATYNGVATLPLLLASKCDAGTCTSLKSDLDVVKACFTDPSDATICRATYNGIATLPLILASKCDGSTCNTLTSDVNVVKSCLTDFTASACTTTYSAATTIPTKLNQVDKCMTNVDDGVCASSYGATLVAAGGQGLVAWTQQLKKPSAVQCTLGKTAPAWTSGTEPNSCSVLGTSGSQTYAPIVFGACGQTNPDKTDNYHLKAGTNLDEIQIKRNGWYKIEMSAFMEVQLGSARLSLEVYKVSSKDSSGTCNSITTACTDLLTLEATNDDKSTTGATNAVIYIPANSEGVFALCAGDKIIAVASRTGATNTNSDIDGAGTNSKTILTVSTFWYE